MLKYVFSYLFYSQKVQNRGVKLLELHFSYHFFRLIIKMVLFELKSYIIVTKYLNLEFQ